MAQIPSPITGLPLSGGTLTGALTVPGITDSTTLAVTGLSTLTGGVNSGGNVDVTAAGSGLRVAEGANAKQGTGTLVAGTLTVANTSVTATSRIFLTGQLLGGTAGGLNVTSRVAGTSFTVTSTNAADTSTFAYEIVEVG